MDNTSILNSLPVCVRNNFCYCFRQLFNIPQNYDITDVLQYTSYNYGELTKYLQEINKHLTKDILFNRQEYLNVPAIEVKRANDHLIASINKIQLFASRNQSKGQLCFYYCNNLINCEDLLDLFLSIANTQDKSIQLLNKPQNQVGTKYLADILQQHRIILYIFYQYYNLINYGRSIFSDNFPDSRHLQVFGFHFHLK
jgi:hypothetical protein